MAVIAIVALLVLGPERLPKAARTVGFYVRKARQSWYSVRSEFERELAAEELKRSLKLDEVHSTLQQTASSVREGLALEHGAPAQTVGQPVAIDDDGLSAEERARQSEALIEPAQVESPGAPLRDEPPAGVISPVSASAPVEMASAVDASSAPDAGAKHVDADPGQRDHIPAGSR